MRLFNSLRFGRFLMMALVCLVLAGAAAPAYGQYWAQSCNYTDSGCYYGGITEMAWESGICQSYLGGDYYCWRQVCDLMKYRVYDYRNDTLSSVRNGTANTSVWLGSVNGQPVYGFLSCTCSTVGNGYTFCSTAGGGGWNACSCGWEGYGGCCDPIVFTIG